MATKTAPMFTTRIDIPEEAREQLIELLNARLADTFDLYSQLKQAHWNVKGSDSIQLHELYDTIAADVLVHVDTIAERATPLGGLALGTTRLAAKLRHSTNTRSTRSLARRRSRRSPIGSLHSRAPSEPKSRPPLSWRTKTPPTCSSKSRAPSTSTFGSSKRTPSRRPRLRRRSGRTKAKTA